MRKRIGLGLLLVLAALGLQAQQKYWVFFTDKGPAAELEQAQQALLSPASLERRATQGLEVDFHDLPVYSPYVAALREAGVQPVHRSRWLNAVSVTTELSLEELYAACPHISGVRPVGRFERHSADGETGPVSLPLTDPEGVKATTFDYGTSQPQLDMLNLPCLHDRGHTGRGVTIAVFDAGFYSVDTISAFDSLWAQNRILDWYDFVDNDTTLFQESSHGMAVLSCIAANLPGTYVGAAPHVKILMGRTENVFMEVHQEEDNWLAGVEWADSIGADIIQSSLGYSVFDPGEGDYTYADMDGQTTIISRAAALAASRGLLVVSSAGNEGAGAWTYITAPCDADSILCTGSVDLNGNRSGFSSIGPSADGRTKPDVVAMGSGTALIGTNGLPANSSGTSFSSPQIAGLAACLWGAHPDRTNLQVMDAIRRSGSIHASPDNELGHGIPDACMADSILTVMDSLALSAAEVLDFGTFFEMYPNPAVDVVHLKVLRHTPDLARIDIIDGNGRILVSEPVYGQAARGYELNLSGLAAGVYLLRINTEDGRHITEKLIRQ